jgi:hypothetical protein
MLLGVFFVATMPLIFHQISALVRQKKGTPMALSRCVLLARNAEDERARASLLHMAQVWFRLAEECVNETDERQSAES